MKTAKWNKPLSKRAYEKIKEKALIGVTIAGRELDFEEFEETIDIYIEKGKVVLPWCDHHDIYDIIFHMIKDDIDTAMRRSREARERAAARRRAREAEASDDAAVNEKSGCMCDDIQPDNQDGNVIKTDGKADTPVKPTPCKPVKGGQPFRPHSGT